MSEIKIGDKVILKNGGPLMTVIDIGNYSKTAGIKDGALCLWFDESTPKEKVFDLATLEKR